MRRRVDFKDGVSVPDLTPEVPAVGLVRFVTQGHLPPRKIAVYRDKIWHWKARRLVYQDLSRVHAIIGDTQHTFFAIRRSPEEAQETLHDALPNAPFFRKAVEWSCTWAPPDLEPAEILRSLLGRLDVAGVYEYPARPNLHPPRAFHYADAPNAESVDYLLDNRGAACGSWTRFFIELACVQGIHDLHEVGPRLSLPVDAAPGVVVPVPIPGDPAGDDVLVTIVAGGGWSKWAESFKTRVLRAVGGISAWGVPNSGVERRNWIFGDHCIAIWAKERLPGRGWSGTVFDPTFERFVPHSDWRDYVMNELTNFSLDFFLSDGVSPANWVSDGANWFPDTGLWTNRSNESTAWHWFFREPASHTEASGFLQVR